MLTEHFSGADGSGDADEIRSSPGDAGAEEAVLRVGCSSGEEALAAVLLISSSWSVLMT